MYTAEKKYDIKKLKEIVANLVHLLQHIGRL